MPSPNDVHKITRDQIEHILKCLRHIDDAQKALTDRGPGNEDIVRELQNCADGVHHVVKDLPLLESA